MWLRHLFVLPIRFYQRWIAPLTPPVCRFTPNCSAYAQRCILVHGLCKGVLLGTWRILRCQPLSEGGHDPVPPPGRWRAQRGALER
jgi:putative membrane protein insertion efficiency factor